MMRRVATGASGSPGVRARFDARPGATGCRRPGTGNSDRNQSQGTRVPLYVLTRLALQLVRLALLPVEAAGPSRSRLLLHRARLVLRNRIG